VGFLARNSQRPCGPPLTARVAPAQLQELDRRCLDSACRSFTLVSTASKDAASRAYVACATSNSSETCAAAAV